MKRRKILLWIFSSLCLLIYFSQTVSARHPACTIMNYYAEDLGDTNRIEPYIVSILALNEVENKRHLNEVKKFIQWYFSRLNYPDHHGLTGTIYVYVLENGQECSTNKYDSADGYAGLFLYLLHQYVVQTGDIEILHKNWDKIEDIAYLISVLQDADGLTRALPDSQVKYLMDNCEAYGGIEAYKKLRKLAGKGDSVYYSRVSDAILAGILKHLYNPDQERFAWAVEKNFKSHTAWEHAYPDAYAQIFPIYYDILIDKPDFRTKLWRIFNEHYARKKQGFPIEQRIIYDLTKQKMEGL